MKSGIVATQVKLDFAEGHGGDESSSDCLRGIKVGRVPMGLYVGG